MVALEAMALNKPIIAAESGGLPEIIQDGENGLLFPVGNIDALVEQIEKLVNSRELREKLGSRAFEDCQGLFTVNRQAESISTIIEDLSPEGKL